MLDGAAGYTFYRSTNGVWLIEQVPPQYLLVPEEDGA
jgi:RNA:NAD 2'-phosphotransferase (TPT1/KptA family)